MREQITGWLEEEGIFVEAAPSVETAEEAFAGHGLIVAEIKQGGDPARLDELGDLEVFVDDLNAGQEFRPVGAAFAFPTGYRIDDLRLRLAQQAIVYLAAVGVDLFAVPVALDVLVFQRERRRGGKGPGQRMAARGGLAKLEARIYLPVVEGADEIDRPVVVDRRVDFENGLFVRACRWFRKGKFFAFAVHGHTVAKMPLKGRYLTPTSQAYRRRSGWGNLRPVWPSGTFFGHFRLNTGVLRWKPGEAPEGTSVRKFTEKNMYGRHRQEGGGRYGSKRVL